jgi:hypothetical protein
MNPKTFGGFYQQGDKRDEEDVKAGNMRVLGVDVPTWALESPIMQTFQLGATVRRLSEAVTKKAPDPPGFVAGAVGGLLGLAEHEPLVDNPERIFKLFDPHDRNYAADELIKGTVEPGLLQNIASWSDSHDKRAIATKILAPENDRSPTTLKEHLETGIPGLRNDVPLKRGK